VAVDLIRDHNVRERKTLNLLAEWLDIADASARRAVLDRLAALPWRDRKLFVASVASPSVRQTMDEVLDRADALDEEVVGDRPTKDDASALQLALSDPNSEVRAFARALLCARRLVAKDVQFLEEWIPHQETRLEVYQSVPSEDLRSSRDRDRYDRTLSWTRFGIDKLKQASEQVRHVLSDPTSNRNAGTRYYGLWSLKSKLQTIDRRFLQLHDIIKQDANRTVRDPDAPSRRSNEHDVSDVAEQWTDLESLLWLHVGEHD
jgi:hypothetical protein